MKNESGITITSLVIYVMTLTLVVGLLSFITIFFNKNVTNVISTIGESVEYSKFNLYILKYVKNGYEIIDSQNDEEKCYIIFSNGEDTITFSLIQNILYFNKAKLCSNVDEFKWKEKIAENGKNVLETLITINGKTYITEYVMH